MYKLVKITSLISCEPHGVRRISDGAFIPFDSSNTDYQEYLKWLDEGNTPLPADEPAQG
jgi:hypothetical protein